MEEKLFRETTQVMRQTAGILFILVKDTVTTLCVISIFLIIFKINEILQ